jgi:hypothetical protein
MTAIRLETARAADRDELLTALAAFGLEPAPAGGDGSELELVCEADDCSDLVHAIDQWLTENGLPLVPERSGDRILLRPPAG